MTTDVKTRAFEPRNMRWNRDQYYRLAEEGYFQDRRVQLINGEIIEMAPQGHHHSKAIALIGRFFRGIFDPQRYWVREQFPLNIGRRSDPEPDVAVVEGTPDRYDDHPTTALLVVEVSDTSLQLDRRKAGLYASARVPEYWIVNLEESKVEVYRNPGADPGAEFGYRYAETSVHDSSAQIAPADRPEAKLSLRELFK